MKRNNLQYWNINNILNLKITQNSSYKINIFLKTKMRTLFSPLYFHAVFLYLSIYLGNVSNEFGGRQIMFNYKSFSTFCIFLIFYRKFTFYQEKFYQEKLFTKMQQVSHDFQIFFFSLFFLSFHRVEETCEPKKRRAVHPWGAGEMV